MPTQPIISLNQILALVGKLDDASSPDTPRERFRQFLEKNVLEVGQVRDYVEECLRNSGDQYSRALQDLVNYLGHFLGFDVTYGRYQGVQGEIGFDGHWKSPTGFHVVVEVKTTDVYAIKVHTLVGYVDRLISSEKKIPNWDAALGLYVVGRSDKQLHQLDNAIIAEKRTQQLRIISVGSLLSLAELMTGYGLGHEEILSIIRPSGPAIDAVVDLMARLVAEPQIEEQQKLVDVTLPQEESAPPGTLLLDEQIGDELVYWLTSVKAEEGETAEQCVQRLVRAGVYAFGDNTPGRKQIKPGDRICFYATGKGIVADAKVVSHPEEKTHPQVHQSDKYRWVFGIADATLYLDNPIVIDAALRSRLTAFRNHDPNAPWAWFVQATRKVNPQDFMLLTRQEAGL
jgi:hypothetical protein